MARVTYKIVSFDSEKGTAHVEYQHPSGNTEKAITKNITLRKTTKGDYATGTTLHNAIAAHAPFAHWKSEEAAKAATNSSEITALVGQTMQITVADDPKDPVMS